MTIDLDAIEAKAKHQLQGPCTGMAHEVLELIAELRKGRAERYWLATRIALDGVSCPVEPNVCAGTCEDHIQCWLEAAHKAVAKEEKE